MRKKYYIILYSLIIIIVFFESSCKSKDSLSEPDSELSEGKTFDISDSAIHYEFNSNNILNYKGIYIQDDTMIFEFDKESEFVSFVQKNKDAKAWINVKNSEKPSAVKWNMIEKEQGCYWVLYCNLDLLSLDEGVYISNCLEDDGDTIDYNRSEKKIIKIKYIETPLLEIENIFGWWYYQKYQDGKWSKVIEQSPYTYNENS